MVFVFIGTIAAPGFSAESERKWPKRERSQAAAAPRGEPGSAWFRWLAGWVVSVSRALAGPGAEAGGADGTRHATIRGQTPRLAVSPFPGSRDVRALLPCVLGTRSPWELASRGRGPRSGGPKTGGQLLCLMTFKGTSTPGKALASLDNRQHLGVPSWRSFARAILLRKPESKQVALPPYQLFSLWAALQLKDPEGLGTERRVLGASSWVPTESGPPAGSQLSRPGLPRAGCVLAPAPTPGPTNRSPRHPLPLAQPGGAGGAGGAGWSLLALSLGLAGPAAEAVNSAGWLPCPEFWDLPPAPRLQWEQGLCCPDSPPAPGIPAPQGPPPAQSPASRGGVSTGLGQGSQSPVSPQAWLRVRPHTGRVC